MPPKTIIFDLHGVIVHKQYLSMAWHLIKHSYRVDLAVRFMHPQSLKTIAHLLRTSRVPEQYFYELVQLHPQLDPSWPLFIAFLNAQKSNDAVIDIIRRLKQEGHRLILFSNIGEKTFAMFRTQFPHIASLFDHHITALAHDLWIQKPDVRAFNKCVQQLHLDPAECIFIDNREENIIAGNAVGFSSICYHNAQQLEHELKIRSCL
ncbi:MAG: HAD-IA family hydrolase [Candidatus Babeliales bacterium]